MYYGNQRKTACDNKPARCQCAVTKAPTILKFHGALPNGRSGNRAEMPLVSVQGVPDRPSSSTNDRLGTALVTLQPHFSL